MRLNAIKAEREGYDAFIIGHFQGAGLYECRSVVDIPVVALGEASMLHACQLGQRTGIVTINPRYISWFHHQIRKYGLEHRVTGAHAMTFEPGEILRADENDDLARTVEQKYAEQARHLVAQGIDVLVASRCCCSPASRATRSMAPPSSTASPSWSKPPTRP